MKTHFTADNHFDHEGILAMTGRPFASIEEHNDALLENINRAVAANDRLFVLGDFAWRGAQSLLDRIRCKNVHLIIGNHDRAAAAKAFKSVEVATEVKIGEGEQQQRVWLSHYPHAYWPSSHYGSMHLYGHMHGEREATLEISFPGRRAMDVGVDNAFRLLGEYRPFSEAEILGFLAPLVGHDPLDFYKRREPLACGRCLVMYATTPRRG